MSDLSSTISAVIPTLDRRHTLSRAINSVLQQTIPVDEIIIVDDGIDEPVCRYLAPPSNKFQKAVDKWTQADFMQTQYFPRGSIFVIVLLSAKSV